MFNTHKIMQMSSFGYNEDDNCAPPDFAIQHMAESLTTSEQQCIREIFEVPHMTPIDVKVVHAICHASQYLKIAPMKMMESALITPPPSFIKGFNAIADIWQRENLIADTTPTSEELNRQFEM